MQLNIAKMKLNKIFLSTMQIKNLNLKKSFDLVLSFGTLHNLN